MHIKIVGCVDRSMWYSNHIGECFKVISSHKDCYRVTTHSGLSNFVFRDDSVESEEPDTVSKEVELLRSVHEAARRVIRFNGVDAAKTIEAFAELKRAVHAANELEVG